MKTSTEPVAKSNDRDFVISCVIDAPRSLVFKFWTDPKLMAQWWGPHGFTNPVCEMDVRPGGQYRIVMRGPDGSELPLKGVYREIIEPERIARTADHSELPDEWHDLMNPNRDKSKKSTLNCLQTTTFEESEGKTKVTVINHFDSATICQSLLNHGMKEGWSQTLERLAKCVSDFF